MDSLFQNTVFVREFWPSRTHDANDIEFDMSSTGVHPTLLSHVCSFVNAQNLGEQVFVECNESECLVEQVLCKCTISHVQQVH